MQDERDLVGTLHPQVVGQMLYAPLDYLAEQFGTDKGPAEHNYTPLYHEKFKDMRYSPITLLELGIWRGASLRMWRAYFPNATIIGLDRRKPLPELDDCDIIQAWGDQDDAGLIDNLASHHAPFDVIIDDASHISSKTIASFKLLWPHLKPGGLYVIEDLQTSYDPEHYGGTEASHDPDHRPLVDGEKSYTAMQFCKRLADQVHPGLFPPEYGWGYAISSVEFHPNICFITKGSLT